MMVKRMTALVSTKTSALALALLTAFWLSPTLASRAAAALMPADVLNVSSGPTVIPGADAVAVAAELGGTPDNTYDGTIQLDFTLSWDTLGNGGGLQFPDFVGGSWEGYIGDANSNFWSINEQRGGSNNWDGLQFKDAGNNSVALAINDPKTFGITIDFVSGGDDTATIVFDGVTQAPLVGDWSFDALQSNAFGSAQVDITNISLSVANGAAVPEPSAIALVVVGLLSVGFVGWRRRRR